MRPLLAALLLLPALGEAQTLAVTINGAITSGTSTVPVLAFNAGSCGSTLGGSWTGTSLTTACTSLQIWVTASSCGTAPSTTNVPADVIIYTAQAGDLANGLATDTFTFLANILPGFSASGSACGSTVDFTNTVCAAVTLNTATNGCTGTNVQAPTVSLRYDNVPPLPPTVTLVPLDSQLSVRLSPSDATDTITSFQAQYAVEPTDGGTPNYIGVGGTIPVNNAAVTISGLINGTNYLVQGFSVDEASNVSVASTPVVGSPVLTLGFYANYLNDGGQPGGCGESVGGGPSALAFAALLVLGVARRRG
jgi:hypothetical protein